MSALGWKIWIVPFALWCLYSCWYCGYQAGYADGHETAWSLSRSPVFFNTAARTDEIPEPQEAEDTTTTEIR